MILYLDTSAIVKKYFEEEGSSEVISLWREASAIVTSVIAYAESMATFHRKKREVEIRKTVFDAVIRSFQRDYDSLVLVEVNRQLNLKIRTILPTCPLRGFDAIHLASALVVNEKLREDFLFVCFDGVLLDAAQRHGLKTIPRAPG